MRLKPRLKDAREARGLSQAALGRTLADQALPGFRPTHVGLFELGYRDATWAEVQALAAALQVEARWLANTEATTPPVVEIATTPSPRVPPPFTPLSPAPGAARAATITPGAVASAAPVAAPARLPPAAVPRGDDTALVYRTRLADQLAAANRTLQDRTLTAAEWRAWRTFGEELRTTLRALG